MMPLLIVGVLGALVGVGLKYWLDIRTVSDGYLFFRAWNESRRVNSIKSARSMSRAHATLPTGVQSVPSGDAPGSSR